MIYLFPNNDSFTIFNDISALPEKYHSELIQLEALPEGEGILRRAEDGTFYHEPFPEIELIEPEVVDTNEPENPTETIEDKLVRLEQKLESQQKNMLVLMNINLTIYEELLAAQEKNQI